jgi:hypothetical protein
MTLVQYREHEQRTERARARAWIELMEPAVELARSIAGTEFVPRALRHNAATISAAILYGDEIGLGPMQSLAQIAVIEGRPTVSAQAQRALVLAAGHELWLEELTATRATWCGRRAGTDAVTRVTWTMDDARRANLAGKQNWRTYPRQMLSARASAELVRAVFADVVGGLAATEEIEGSAGQTPDVEVVAQSEGTGTRRRRRAAKVAAAVPAHDVVPPATVDVDLPPLPGEDTPSETGTPMITRAQQGRMHGLMRSLQITERADRLTYASQVLGRDVRSSKELTTDEADRVIDALTADMEAPFPAEDTGDTQQEIPL